uniref:Uncharacterized protein n=1 Tax=Panagrolaimus sp. PS1159 TaxID=55785 RepID=A0AC35ESQ5_9BILA
PTGAYAFQRLAIAVGPCVVIYHINAISVNHKDEASDSPVSSLSESSANTVVRAPTISISAPKSEEEETAEHEDDTHNDSDRPSRELKRKHSQIKTKPEKIEAVKEKVPRKTVQFKIDSSASRLGAKSPEPRKPLQSSSEPTKIKPSLKQPKPIQETDDEKTPIADLSYNFSEICRMSDATPDGEASVSDEISVPSPIPIPNANQIEGGESPKIEERGREEEKAEDADSENSETPAPESKNENFSSEAKSNSPLKKQRPEIPPIEITEFRRVNRDID